MAICCLIYVKMDYLLENRIFVANGKERRKYRKEMGVKKVKFRFIDVSYRELSVIIYCCEYSSSHKIVGGAKA